MIRIIMFGPPGSGKGTQSKKLAERYNLAHISTGDIFRKEMSEGSELGNLVKNIVDKGELVPDNLLIQVIKKALEDNSDYGGHIFDGFPRTVRQARDFDILLEEMGCKLSKVLRLKVMDDEIITRLMKRAELEGRKDDTKEIISNRLRLYREKTMPLLDYYREQQIIAELEGVGDVNEIFDKLTKEIDGLNR